LKKEEDGTFSVHCPALKGCHFQGNSKEEALLNIREAIDLYLGTAKGIALHTTSRQSGCSLIEMTYKKMPSTCFRDGNGTGLFKGWFCIYPAKRKSYCFIPW